VIDLATALLVKPGLEESYYWRARAYAATGDVHGAEADMRAALAERPNWQLALKAMGEWGIKP
jgi:hypothetical protein